MNLNEQDILQQSYALYQKNKPKSINDVFNINLCESNFEKKFFTRTLLLLLHQCGKIEKIQCDFGHYAPVKFKILLNEKYKNSFIEDITEVSFDNIIPRLFLSHNTELFNYIGSMDMYRSVFEEYELNKNYIIKEYINSMYGVMMSKSELILPIVTPKQISLRMNYLMKSIIDEFSGHYVYVDTDTVYFCRFAEISKRFENHIQQFTEKDNYRHLKYTLTHHEQGSIFLNNKKFIIYGDRVKGIKVIKNDSVTYGKIF